jgi:hypothetical protein
VRFNQDNVVSSCRRLVVAPPRSGALPRVLLDPRCAETVDGSPLLKF